MLQHMFTVEWPASYRAKGYSSFTFASESLEETKDWHGAILAAIGDLKAGGSAVKPEGSSAANIMSSSGMQPHAAGAASPALSRCEGRGKGVVQAGWMVKGV